MEINLNPNSSICLEETPKPILRMRLTLGILAKEIISQNHLVYCEVVAIRATQTSRFERPIIEEFFTLEDAVGRVVPASLRLVDSWDMFHALLIMKFKCFQGAVRVAKNLYILQAQRSRTLSTAVSSGQRIDMSSMCRRWPTTCGPQVSVSWTGNNIQTAGSCPSHPLST